MASLTDDFLPDLMPAWKKVFRNGLLPHITEIELRTLRKLIVEDDKRLLQGATTTPPPLMCVQDWSVEAACLTGMCGWASLTAGELTEATVGDVEAAFAKLCFDIDQTIGEPGGVRHLLCWYDETPRDEMRRELLIEIDLALSNK